METTQNRNIKLASFSVLALCFVAMVVFLTQNQGPKISLDQSNALKRTDLYAQKLIKSKFIVETPAPPRPSRGLASVGNYQQEVLEGPVGLDPWGYHFHFLVKKNPQNPKVGVLVIWSAGEDNKLDTTRDMIAENHYAFEGDDFGRTYPFTF